MVHRGSLDGAGPKPDSTLEMSSEALAATMDGRVRMRVLKDVYIMANVVNTEQSMAKRQSGQTSL